MVTSPVATHYNVPVGHHASNIYGKYRKGIYHIVGDMLRRGMMGWSILKERPKKCLKAFGEETLGKEVNTRLSDNQASTHQTRKIVRGNSVLQNLRVCSRATRQFFPPPIVAPPVFLPHAGALVLLAV
jgi:hypothetical protein